RARQLLKAWKELTPNLPAVKKLVAELKKHGTTIVPTLALLEAILKPDTLKSAQPDLLKLPEEMQQFLVQYLAAGGLTAGWDAKAFSDAREAFQNILRFTRHLQREGIPILAG